MTRPPENLKGLSESTPITLPLATLMDWRKEGASPRLWLPPIQRSAVWTNAQIINYLDSLLRGYPAGLMMVYPISARACESHGIDADGKTCSAIENGHYQLFDGQQRLAAVTLAMGQGQLKEARRLWVDLGQEPTPESGLRYQLRISSRGQPFGYKPQEPNQKFGLDRRRSKREEKYGKQTTAADHSDHSDEDVFERSDPDWLIDSRFAIPLEAAVEAIRNTPAADGEELTARLSTALRAIRHNGEPCYPETLQLPERSAAFLIDLKKALDSRVIIQQLPRDILRNDEEYIRFFGRIGQGGTRLSDGELTFSILKNQFPELRDNVASIARRFSSLIDPVDLVLAALRTAKMIAPWDGAKVWEIIERPTPKFASSLVNKQFTDIRQHFMELMTDTAPRLADLLRQLRTTLIYDRTANEFGIPPMLLARLPVPLVDVLVFLCVAAGDSTRSQDAPDAWPQAQAEALTVFVLYWLLFVDNDEKAARITLETLRERMRPLVFDQASIRTLISEFEEQGVAQSLPGKDQRARFREIIESDAKAQAPLRHWAHRFALPDSESGTALRRLATDRESMKRALMWLQRDYLTAQEFDPTLSYDEDMPFDLDHIIPQSIFGFWWNPAKRLEGDWDKEKTFRWQREEIGNSLGNFRWLKASDNRERGNGKYVPIDHKHEYVSAPEVAPSTAADDWNKLIPENSDSDWQWSLADVHRFQRLIDLRSLRLFEVLIEQSGVARQYFDEEARS